MQNMYILNYDLCFVQDQNRYSAAKGVHLNLKRAERARLLVSKLPCKYFKDLCDEDAKDQIYITSIMETLLYIASVETLVAII